MGWNFYSIIMWRFALVHFLVISSRWLANIEQHICGLLCHVPISTQSVVLLNQTFSTVPLSVVQGRSTIPILSPSSPIWIATFDYLWLPLTTFAHPIPLREEHWITNALTNLQGNPIFQVCPNTLHLKYVYG